MKPAQQKTSFVTRLKAWFKAHFLTKEESPALQLNRKKQPTTPKLNYHVDCELRINGHLVGHFPLTVKAHSKNQVADKINKETVLVPTNIRRVK